MTGCAGSDGHILGECALESFSWNLPSLHGSFTQKGCNLVSSPRRCMPKFLLLCSRAFLPASTPQPLLTSSPTLCAELLDKYMTRLEESPLDRSEDTYRVMAAVQARC